MTRPQDSTPGWVADDSLLWNIAITAAVPSTLSDEAVHTARRQLNERLGTPDQLIVAATDAPLGDLCARPGPEAVRTHLTSGELTIVAQHRYLDGLGLLAALGELTGAPVASNARGLGEAPEAGFAGAAVRRLAEVAFTPPAVIAASGGVPGGSQDVFARTVVSTTCSSAQAAFAATRACILFNQERGQRSRNVAVAVGASRRAGDALTLADESALLRLVHVDQAADVDTVRAMLRSAVPVPVATGEAASGLRGRAVGLALQLLGGRLGSTVLVSHLGEVETSAGVHDLAFYPVTGGASGLSVGLVGSGGHTVITARARSTRLDASALREFLALLSDQLG